MRVSEVTCINKETPFDAQPPGSLRGRSGPPQGVSEAPRGELDSPLEVSRLCRGLWNETYETGY